MINNDTITIDLINYKSLRIQAFIVILGYHITKLTQIFKLKGGFELV